MSVGEVLATLRSRWLVVLFVAIVGAGVGAGIFFIRPQTYTAHTKLYVSSQADNSTTASYQGSLLSQNRTASYVDLISSQRITEAVVEQLGLNESPSDLARQIDASTPPDSAVIDVYVTQNDAQLSADATNAVAQNFTALVNELERPLNPAIVQPVVVKIVEPAGPPPAPSSRSLPQLIVLGLLGGLALGISSAIALYYLDTTIRSLDAIKKIREVPNLGVVPFDENVDSPAIVVNSGNFDGRSEAYRRIRTNIEFVDLGHTHSVIMFTSALPGDGKTTTVANVGAALVAAGRSVVIVEADLRRPRLSSMFDIESAVGLTTILLGKVRPEQACQRVWGGLDVLPAGLLPPNPSEVLGSQQMADLVSTLRERYEYVLLDLPPVLVVSDAVAASPSTDGVVVVVRYGKTTQAQLKSTLEGFDAASTSVFGTVLNATPQPRNRASYYGGYYGQYESQSKSSLLSEPVKASARPLNADDAITSPHRRGEVRPAPRPRQ